MNTVKDRARGYFARHGLGTFDLICSFAKGDKSEKAVEAALAELRAEGRLHSLPFGTRKHLYVATSKLARELSLGERGYAKRPGIQKILEALTVAHFCNRHGFTLMTRVEFSRTFPELFAIKKFRRARHFIEPGETPRLVVIVPDFHSRWENVVKKARKAISLRKGYEQFMKFIRDDQFRVALVTANEQKADILRYALADEAPLVRVYVVPELFSLMEGA